MKKYLLNALMLCVALLFGTSAQAAGYTRTLNEDISITGYELKQFYNFQTNTPEVLPTSGDLRYRAYEKGGYWGLHNFGGAGRSGTATIPVKKGDILILQHYSSSVISTIDCGTLNESLTSTTGYQVYDITTDAESITFTIARYGGIVAAVVMKEEEGVTKYTYNFNYTFEGNTIKTLTGSVPTGTTVVIENPIEVEETRYFVEEGEELSYTIEEDITKDIPVRKAKTFSYTYNAMYEGNNIATIASGELTEGDSKSIAYNRFYNVDGALVVRADGDGKQIIDKSVKDYSVSIKPTSDNFVMTQNYINTGKENIVFMAEAEDIETLTPVVSGYLAERFSGGKGAYAEGSDQVITTLGPGNYRLTAHIMGTISQCTFTFKAGNQTIWEATTDENSFYVGDGITSDVFELTQETDIILVAGGGNGSSSKVTNAVDFIYIQYLGESRTYKVTMKSEDGTINKKLAEGKGYSNDAPLSFAYPKYLNGKGTLYQADGSGSKKNEYNFSVNMKEGDVDTTITYKPTNITEVALFTEGEDIEGITKTTKDNIAIRASQSAAGYAADGEVTVGTIATGGTYKMVAQLAGSGRNGETTFAFAANGTTVFEPVLGAKSNLGGGTSERFSVQDGATITLAQGGDANSAVDFVYVYKVEDFNIAEDAEYFAKSTEQNPNDGVLSNHLIGKDGSTLEVTSDKENAGAIWEDTWQEEVDGNMVDKSFVDLRIQKDGAFIISTSSNSLSLRKIVFTGAALQMTPSDGQFEGQAASRVNKAAPAMVTKTWTGNIDKVKFWADSLVRISTIKLYVEASDGNTATYEDKPRPEKPADKPALEVVADIAAFKALADSTEAKLTLTDAVVTFVNGKNIYLEDATGAIVLYDMGLELTEGQKLNGLLAGKTVNYFALPEMVKTDSTKTDTFTAEAGEVKATTMALADICKVENLARLITISNVTIDVVDNNIFATSGDEKLQVYNKFKVDGLDLQKGNVYTSITGILVPWQNKETLEITYELAPRTLADLVLDADATGISELAGEKAAREVYNLNGQRVNATKKGLYIINGKKVMVK